MKKANVLIFFLKKQSFFLNAFNKTEAQGLELEFYENLTLAYVWGSKVD